MTLDADQIIDRRRLNRRLTFWRVLGVGALVAAVVAVAGRFDLVGEDDHVARFVIAGIIFDDQAQQDALDGIADNDKAKALMVKIDSPGGTFVGGEALYQTLRRVAKKKPVVALMGNTATSAGYMTALGSDHIVARASSLTGSIGVIMQTADFTGLLEKLEPFTPEARKATEVVIQDFYNMFVDLVAERRSLPSDKVLALADGRVFSGRQAKEVGLVDALGSEPEARKWLAETHEISDSLPVKEVKTKHGDEPWRDLFDSIMGKVLFSERLRLDGVISLWHPDLWW